MLNKLEVIVLLAQAFLLLRRQNRGNIFKNNKSSHSFWNTSFTQILWIKWGPFPATKINLRAVALFTSSNERGFFFLIRINPVCIFILLNGLGISFYSVLLGSAKHIGYAENKSKERATETLDLRDILEFLLERAMSSSVCAAVTK